MYGNLIQLLTALSAALAAGFGVLYLGRVLSELELAEKHENLPQRLPLFVRLLLPFISVTRPAASGNAFAVWRDMAAPKLWMAGLGDAFTPVDYIALRLVFLIVSLLLIVLGMAAGQILICLALALLFAVYPGVWISSTIRKRQLSIMKALPNVLDLLTLSVESGRDLLSALRDILARRKVDPLGEELLRPTKIYVKPVLAAMEQAKINGVSHITGGGFYENIPRCIPDGLCAKIEKSALRIPPIFTMLRRMGNVSEHDMFNTYNMGTGMTLIAAKEDADRAIAALKENGQDAYVIGEVVSGEEKVTLC